MRRSGELALLAACVLGAGLASLARGQDANWDLRNYHYYNAFAFLHGRLGWDLAPAQIQTFLNPIGDLPFYALVHALPGPRWVAFAMALPTALAAFFLLKLLAAAFPAGTPHRMLCVLAAAAIGLTSATGLAELGSTMNEWSSAALVVAAAYLALRSMDRPGDEDLRGIAMAGFLVGAATGLKLTNACFALGLVAALGCFGSGRQRVMRCAAAGAGAAAGLLLLQGYWSAVLQGHFGSPLFPFWNEFFKSPWWEIHNWVDAKFGPRGVLQAAFFPLWFARQPALVSEISFRDYRLATLLVVGLWVAARALTRRGNSRPRQQAASPRWTFLAVFALASYAAWQAVFAVHRYLLPLEVLSGALIVGGVAYALRSAGLRRAAIVALALLLVGTTRKPGWEREPFGEAYFAVSVPAVEAGALVVMGYGVPASYLIPHFPRDARFVAPASNFMAPGQGNRLAREMAAAIERHPGRLYLLEERLAPPENAALLRHFRLERDAAGCAGVRSNLDRDALRLCALRRARAG